MRYSRGANYFAFHEACSRPRLRPASSREQGSRLRFLWHAIGVAAVLSMMVLSSCSNGSHPPAVPALLERAVGVSDSYPRYTFTGREVIGARSRSTGLYTTTDRVVFKGAGSHGGRILVLSARFTHEGGFTVAGPWFVNAHARRVLEYRVGSQRWRCGAYIPDGFPVVAGTMPPFSPLGLKSLSFGAIKRGQTRTRFNATGLGGPSGNSIRYYVGFTVDRKGPFVTEYTQTWVSRGMRYQIAQKLTYQPGPQPMLPIRGCPGSAPNFWHPGLPL